MDWLFEFFSTVIFGTDYLPELSAENYLLFRMERKSCVNEKIEKQWSLLLLPFAEVEAGE